MDPSGHGARRDPRLTARIPVDFGVEALDRRALAENISVGGVYLNTGEILGSGTRITMRFEFPWGLVWHRGEVIWAIAPPKFPGATAGGGMGVRLLDTTPEWPVLLGSWEAARAGANAERDPAD